MASGFSKTGDGDERVSPASATPSVRILLVDDEPTIRRIVGKFLREDGHHVQTAEDGQQALEWFNGGTWDVVITDRVMPKMTGDALARAIKKTNSTIPIILLTAFADRSPNPAGRGSPFNMIIRKPFTRETLRAAISSCVLGGG